MSSEGSREIEAARKRLLAAKTQASAASKHKEMIANLMESANSMLDTAEKEVTEAKTMLKDAEKRWEVINIDIDSPKKKEGSSNKKRKVSLSPQGNNNSPVVDIGSNPAPGTQSKTYTYETVKISFESGRKLGVVLADRRLVNPPSNNQDMRSNTVVSISYHSIIFKFADDLLNAVHQSMPPLIDPSNLDELIEWGRKELPPLKFRYGSVSFDTMNGEFLKCVLDGKVHAGDIVEKVQYTCPTQLTTTTLHCPRNDSRHKQDLVAVPETP